MASHTLIPLFIKSNKYVFSKMKTFSKFLPLVAVTVVATSCNDYDAGLTTDVIKQREYEKHFVQTFGEIDPEQDWSMATLVSANVNLPEIKGTAKMNICTGDPRLSSTRLLAQIMLQNGQGHIDFDAIKGESNVFVTVEQDGEYKVFGQYGIVNGFLCIGDVQMPMTRAGVGNVTEVSSFSSTCPTTQRTGTTATVDYTYFDNIVSTTVIDGIKYPKTDNYTNSNNMKTLEGWIAYAKSGGVTVTWNQWTKSVTNNTPFTDESMLKFSKITKSDFSGVVLKDANYAEENSDGTITLYLDAGGKSANSGWISKKTVAEWQQDAIDNYSGIVSGTYNGPWTNESLLGCFTTAPCSKDDDGAVYDGMTDETTWELKDSAEPHYANVYPTFQYLDGVEQKASSAINLGTLNSFFGFEDGKFCAFFAESVSIWDSRKLGVYYDEPTLRKMENGFSIVTTEKQVIELPYVFGCTAYSNQFGYIYYKAEDEANIDPITLKHYVLIEDGRPSKNIYRGEWKTGTPVKGDDHGSLADWDYKYSYTLSDNSNIDLTWNGTYPERGSDFVCACDINGTGIYSDSHQHLPNCYSPSERFAWVAQHGIVGTTYRPMFFGEDGDASQGTYEWPEGYKIVFWINTLATGNADGQDNTVRNHPEECFTSSGGLGGHFNYSLPTINKRLFHNYQGELSHTEEELKTLGQVQCISWTVDGNTFLAFGDVCGDKDLNDMVFMVSAPNSNPDNSVVTVPVKWHLNYNRQHEENDLFDNYTLNQGASYTNPKKTNGDNSEPSRFGYTFVGWSTNPPATTGNPTISGTVPTTSTAAIHYYAIWEPVGKSYTITWHKNYDSNVYGNDDCGKDDPETDAADIHKQQIVGENERFTKPNTNPTAPTEKVFKGWSLTPTGDILPESWFENPTNMTATGDDENICFYAIYEDAPTPGPDPEAMTWIFACEDLGGSFDYDFNDVVWSVKTTWNESVASTKVKVLAAGGTLGFALKFNGTEICNKFNAFTETTTDEQVVNAGALEGVIRTPNEFTLVTAITTISTEWTKFSVVVSDHGNSVHEVQNVKESTKNSKAPQIILLPEQWEWPTELTPINQAYTNFDNWVTDNTAATWSAWSDHKQSGKTVSRQ